MIRPLTDDQCRKLLRRCRLGRIGCIVNGCPYVVPMNFVFDGHYIYCHSHPGKKIKALRGNPAVCFQVDAISREINWQSVLVRGVYQEIKGAEEQAFVMRSMLSLAPSLTPVESITPNGVIPPVVTFRIEIKEITGRCEE